MKALFRRQALPPHHRSPYRWRDWAAREDGLTGDELLTFINQDECHRADGSRGAGLFAWLRGLAGSGEKGSQREVIANVFRGVQNRMVSGYLLRDIINKINGIHFSSSSTPSRTCTNRCCARCATPPAIRKEPLFVYGLLPFCKRIVLMTNVVRLLPYIRLLSGVL